MGRKKPPGAKQRSPGRVVRKERLFSYRIIENRGKEEQEVAVGGGLSVDEAVAFCEGFIAGRYHPSTAKSEVFVYEDEVVAHVWLRNA
jgi:hypothetical protein